MPPGPTTAQQVVANAFIEAGIYDPNESPNPKDFSFGLSKLNRLLDAWNSDSAYIYAVDFLQLILVPNVQPLTIGLGVNITSVSSDGTNATYVGINSYQEGDFVSTANIGTVGGLNFDANGQTVVAASGSQFSTSNPGAVVASTPVVGMAIYSTPLNIFPTYATLTQRPTRIVDANIILNNLNPIVKCPLRIRDKDWWISNTIPNVPTSIPTDLYYDPLWPNGQIYLWPEQDVNYGLELEVWNNLAGLTSLNQQFYFSTGYEDAITWKLAESFIPSYNVPGQVAASIMRMAQMAINKIQINNSQTPKMATRDSGIPRGGRGGTLFNWLNGTTVPPR
jgi:hypothetical protein